MSDKKTKPKTKTVYVGGKKTIVPIDQPVPGIDEEPKPKKNGK